jgi:hypothetical protein
VEVGQADGTRIRIGVVRSGGRVAAATLLPVLTLDDGRGIMHEQARDRREGGGLWLAHVQPLRCRIQEATRNTDSESESDDSEELLLPLPPLPLPFFLSFFFRFFFSFLSLRFLSFLSFCKHYGQASESKEQHKPTDRHNAFARAAQCSRGNWQKIDIRTFLFFFFDFSSLLSLPSSASERCLLLCPLESWNMNSVDMQFESE